MGLYLLARDLQQAGVTGDKVTGTFGRKRSTRGDARNVLVELLNCRTDAEGIIRFTRKFGPIVSSGGGDTFEFHLKTFRQIQDHFRSFWEAPATGPVPLPAFQSHIPGQFAALWYRIRRKWATESLLNWLAASALAMPSDYFRKCANPSCVTPYFIATRTKRLFCSDACALDAKRAAGLAWWRQHGEAWRQKRTRAAKKSARSKAGRKNSNRKGR
jgi:hypothetical protein